jgi:hypothetical protein
MQTENDLSDYPTCEKCYATLCISSEDIDIDEITRELNIPAATLLRKGELVNPFSKRVNPLNVWSLSSKSCVGSRDLRHHIDWLFDQITSQRAEIESLRARGCTFIIWCYWLSKYGHDGPTLSVSQSKKLADFEFELVLDVYLFEEPDSES